MLKIVKPLIVIVNIEVVDRGNLHLTKKGNIRFTNLGNLI